MLDMNASFLRDFLSKTIGSMSTKIHVGSTGRVGYPTRPDRHSFVMKVKYKF